MRDWAGPGLSIVIPVYNSQTSIGDLLEALSCLQPEGGLEIVLVNDGSPDGSHDICRRFADEARLPVVYVQHTRNFGEHNAVLTGLRHASGAYVVTMDDDLQNPPSEVLKLYDHARRSGLDVVYTRYATKQHALWRNLGSRFANRVADRLLDKPKGLYLSSFRCMSRATAQAIADYRGPYPYIDGLIMQVTQRVGAIEVEHLPRAAGCSNYTLPRLLGLWLNLATSFSLAPLRLAVVAGLIMALAGAVGAVATVIEALTTGTPSGWASLAVILLIVGGVQCLMLGVIGEYVGRTFLSSSGKPQSVVREVVRRDAAEPRRADRRLAAVVSL